MPSELGSNYLSTPCVVYCDGIRNCSLGSSFDPDGTGTSGTLLCKDGHWALFVLECAVNCNWYWHCSNLLSSGLATNGWWFPDRREQRYIYEATERGLINPVCKTTNFGQYYGDQCSALTAFMICLYNGGTLSACNKNNFCCPAFYVKVVYY